jgi:hypothetical protein
MPESKNELYWIKVLNKNSDKHVDTYVLNTATGCILKSVITNTDMNGVLKTASINQVFLPGEQWDTKTNQFILVK